MNAGPFSDVVKDAGFLMTASLAIGLSWRRRTKWEPDISDIPDAPSKVAGLLTTIFLAELWFDGGKSIGLPPFPITALMAAAITVAGLLTYVFLNTTLLYNQEYAIDDENTKFRRIIGGLWLTPAAREKHRTVPEIELILKLGANNADAVWPRPARAISQLLFILAYIALVTGGTSALTAAALLVKSKL